MTIPIIITIPDAIPIALYWQAFVWEPALVRQNALAAATEAAVTVLSVDETVRNPKSEGLPDQGRPNM